MEALLSQLAAYLELPAFPEEGAGQYALEIEGGFKITFSPVDRAIILSSSLSRFPTGGNDELFLSRMLEANLDGQGTKNLVLGLTEDGEHLKLSKKVDKDLDFASFRDIFEDFIDMLDMWSEEAETSTAPR